MSRGHKAPELQQTVKPLLKFMREQGWRPIRHESGYVPGAGSFGEKGMPDYQFIRYLEHGVACVLWIEAKAPGSRSRCNCSPAERNPQTGRMRKAHECRSCGQARWAAAERARGAVVIKVEDVEQFKLWYAERYSWIPAPPQPQMEMF